MKYVKRCLVLLLALVMTMALIRPATTMAKYTTSETETLDVTLDTTKKTYVIKNVLQQGNFSTLNYQEDPKGYRVNTIKNGMQGVGHYKDATETADPDKYYRQVWVNGGHLQVEDTDTINEGTHNIWIYADLNTNTNRATEGHLYYLRTRYYIYDLGGSNGISFRITDIAGENEEEYGFKTFNVEKNWSYGQTILQAPDNFNVTVNNETKAKDLGGCLRIGGTNSGQPIDTKLRYNISHIMLVDLTATFGAGNEPPLWWCNTYIPWVDETTSGTKTVQWFPEDSMSRLDTAFHNGTTGYYYDDGDSGYYRDENQSRQNVATVDVNGNITLSGEMTDVNSTSLGNP